jgi:hypothetical protein
VDTNERRVLRAGDGRAMDPWNVTTRRSMLKPVPDCPGSMTAGNLTHPEALAEALIEFFAPAQQPA